MQNIVTNVLKQLVNQLMTENMASCQKLTDWLSHWLTHRLTDSLTNSLTHRLIHWLTDSLTKRIKGSSHGTGICGPLANLPELLKIAKRSQKPAVLWAKDYDKRNYIQPHFARKGLASRKRSCFSAQLHPTANKQMKQVGAWWKIDNLCREQKET